MYMVLSEFVLEKTIYPHIYCRLGFHMNIEMPALDLAQNFVCSARTNLGNFCSNLSLQNSKHVACCLYPKIMKIKKKIKQLILIIFPFRPLCTSGASTDGT